jgi:expansin (peptidoglycan-binding protein)
MIMRFTSILQLFFLLSASWACEGGGPGEDGASDPDAAADPDTAPDTAPDTDTPPDAGDVAADDPAVDGPACSTTVHEGVATYYTFADGGGNCMFPPTPDDLNVAAINNEEYASSGTCGGCVFIQGPIGTVTVRIVDRCPECLAGHLDLSPSAFEQIARIEEGRVSIQWHFVPCDVSGPIRYHFKEGSNPWWTAVQIRNHRHLIAKLEYMDGSGSFREVPRLDYNFFVEESGMGPGPYTFRVTDEYGQVLTDSGIPHVEGGEVEGAGQFPPCM